MNETTSNQAAPPDIPGYRVLRAFESGPHADVFLAQQEAVQRTVAIKWFRASKSDDRSTAELAEATAVTMGRFSHPHVVGILDRGLVDGRPYLIVEHMPGGNLDSRLEPGRPLPVFEAMGVASGVSSGLTALHRHNVVHGNLTPQNILFDENGGARISDFGGSQPEHQPLHAAEAHEGERDARADQFALALVTYQMLVGLPFSDTNERPSKRNPNLPPQLDHVLLRALRERPAERYPSVRDFYSALESALGEQATGSTSDLAFGSRRNHPWLTLVVFLAVALVGSLGLAVRILQNSSGQNAGTTRLPPLESGYVRATAALIHRHTQDQHEFLLIRSPQNLQWSVPMASAEEETTSPELLAEKVAFNEAGIAGNSRTGAVGIYSYSDHNMPHRVHIYVVDVHETSPTPVYDAELFKWCSHNEALSLVGNAELRAVLAQLQPNTWR